MVVVVLDESTPSSSNNQLLLDAANYYLGILLPEDGNPSMRITLQITDLGDTGRGETWCIPVQHEGYIKLNQADDFITQLSSLAHETVHVKQMVTGKLSVSNSGKRWKWNGRYMKASEPYELSPWEREAFALETSLAQGFVSHELFLDHMDRQANHAKL